MPQRQLLTGTCGVLLVLVLMLPVRVLMLALSDLMLQVPPAPLLLVESPLNLRLTQPIRYHMTTHRHGPMRAQ